MIKKCFSIFVVCIFTVTAIAAEKVDYKKFMEGYAQAYSSMDSKQLKNYVSKKFLNKLKWEFHEFRKVHKKLQLKLTDIIVKKNIISCNAVLVVGGKVKYKNKPIAFVFKDGKIEQQLKQIQSPAVAKTKHMVRNARDFWSAAKVADTFAVVKVERYKSSAFQKLLPLLKGYKGEEVKLNKWIQFYAPNSGQYLIPVVKDRENYKVIGYGYRFPAYDSKTITAFLKQWKEFKALKADEETEFLKKQISTNLSLAMTHAALSRLLANGYFKVKLNKEDLDFWKKIILDSKLNLQLNTWLIGTLSRYNFATAKPIFEAALKDEKLTSVAAVQLARHNREDFRKQMLEWLKDDKMRKLALKNSFILMKDKEFVNTAMKYFKNSDVEEVKQYLMILLAKDNIKGNAVIREILSKQPEKYKKLIPKIYMMIIRTGNPAWTDEILKLAESTDQKGFYAYAKPLALAYLCRHKKVEGFELTSKYLKSIKDDKRRQQQCLRTFSMVYRRHFSLPQLNEFIKSAGNPKTKKTKNNINKK